MQLLKLLVVIIDYKTPELTIQCLRSLEAEISANPHYRVTVVNNSPESNSQIILEEFISKLHWCDLISAPTNLGFSAGNNFGIRNSKDSEYVLLLNSDTIVKPNCIESSLRAIEKDKLIGALSCCVLNEDGSIQHVARKFPTPLKSIICAFGLPWKFPKYFSWASDVEGFWDKELKTREVEWLGGAYLLIRMNIFPTKNILNESFFFYGEDIEICHRIKKLGYKIIYEPSGKTIHLGGASSDPSRMKSESKSLNIIKSRYMVQEECYGKFAAYLLRLSDIVMSLAKCIKHSTLNNTEKAKAELIFLNLICKKLPENVQQIKAKKYLPKRVAFILPGLHKINRGAEVAFEAIAQELAKDTNLEITLIGSGGQRENQNYHFIHVFSFPRERFANWPKLPILRDAEEYEELTFCFSLLAKYNPKNFDLVITCSYPFINWFINYYPSKFKPKHIFVTQNGDWPLINLNKSEYRFFKCSALVCTNNVFYERNKTKWTTELIPNGTHTSRFKNAVAKRQYFNIPDEVSTILISSALITSKRIIEGIIAVSKVNDCFLVIAGQGPLHDEIKKAADNLLKERYILKSYEREEMPNLYKSVDLFLHMSIDEPSANVYIEALASGLPIVTHDREVTRWTLEDAAILVDTNDTVELIKAIKFGLKNKKDFFEKTTRLAKNKYEWEKLSNKYKDFINSLTAS